MPRTRGGHAVVAQERELFRFEMQAQNSPHFFDGLRMRLSRVARAHDFLRYDSVNMCAFIRNHTVAFPRNRSLAEHGND